jgi:hypothetical protein
VPAHPTKQINHPNKEAAYWKYLWRSSYLE